MEKQFRTADVVGLGTAWWDEYFVVPWHPEPEEMLRAIDSDECAGGDVPMALVALARWGLRCRFVGMLGFDPRSERILDDLVQEGIDVESVVRREDAAGPVSIVLVDNRTGRRSVVNGPHRIPPLPPKHLSIDLFAKARVLHLDNSVDECGIEAAMFAREAGLTITLDARSMGRRTPELMRQCDYILASREFVEQATNQTRSDLAAYALHLQTERPVILLDGERGCEFVSKELSFYEPVLDVPVVDRTGAAEVFGAAFIYGLLAAWDMRKIIRFCIWAAGRACGEIGGRKGIPSLTEVHGFGH